MRIGIDISQIVHEGTGVGKYVQEMVRALVREDSKNEYILFGASLRKRQVFSIFFDSLSAAKKVTLKVFPIPPTLLDLLWNILHIFPIQWFIGKIDVFWSSDWTQPPLGSAKGMTTIHDLIAIKFPEETHNLTEFSGSKMNISSNIHAVHIRRLRRVKEECDVILCDSEATKNDCISLLGLDPKSISVVYPGYSL